MYLRSAFAKHYPRKITNFQKKDRKLNTVRSSKYINFEKKNNKFLKCLFKMIFELHSSRNSQFETTVGIV